jgi:hypothetical protein
MRSRDVHPKMRNDNVVGSRCRPAGNGKDAACRQSYAYNARDMPEGGRTLKIEERRMSTGDSRNAPFNTWDNLDYWRRNSGILGHDGKPRFYDSETGKWTRLTPEPRVTASDTAKESDSGIA